MLTNYYDVFNYISMKKLKNCVENQEYNKINSIINKNKFNKELQFLDKDFDYVIDSLLDYLWSNKQQSNLINIYVVENICYLRKPVDVDKPIKIFIENDAFIKFITSEFNNFKIRNFVDCLGYPIINSNIINYISNINIIDEYILKKVILMFLNIVHNYLDDYILNILFFGLYNLYNFFSKSKCTIDLDKFYNIIKDTDYLENLSKEIDDTTLKGIRYEFYKLINFKNNIYDDNHGLKNLFEFSNIEGLFILYLYKLKMVFNN